MKNLIPAIMVLSCATVSALAEGKPAGSVYSIQYVLLTLSTKSQGEGPLIYSEMVTTGPNRSFVLPADAPATARKVFIDRDQRPKVGDTLRLSEAPTAKTKGTPQPDCECAVASVRLEKGAIRSDDGEKSIKTDGVFVLVEVKLKNLSSVPRMPAWYSFGLTDSEGRRYAEDPRLDSVLPVGGNNRMSINPGMERRCFFLFEVPVDAKGLLFTVPSLTTYKATTDGNTVDVPVYTHEVEITPAPAGKTKGALRK